MKATDLFRLFFWQHPWTAGFQRSGSDHRNGNSTLWSQENNSYWCCFCRHYRSKKNYPITKRLKMFHWNICIIFDIKKNKINKKTLIQHIPPKLFCACSAGVWKILPFFKPIWRNGRHTWLMLSRFNEYLCAWKAKMGKKQWWIH